MEMLILVTALVSCGAFFLVMLTLLMVLHRNNMCCTQTSDEHWEEAVQHSVHSLINQFSNTILATPITPISSRAVHRELHRRGFQVEQLYPGSVSPRRDVFVVGKPSHYHLCGPAPRLPSYDTVRREDRRSHALAAQPPPSYEESVQVSLEPSTVSDTALTTDDHRTGVTPLNQDHHAALE